MTLKTNHSFVSTKPVGDNATRIYSDSWNADHVLTGAADATQLNANVVQSVVNDTNIQGAISAQTLTFSWGGTLAAGRGGFGADISASNGVPLFATGVATFTGTTGSGNFARATSPTFVTPTLGAALATSINGNSFTTGTYTLTGTAGKTFTFSNSLTLAGTDGTTQTFQASDTIVGRATTDTLTNKTFDTAGTGNSLKINGTALTAVTGTGSAVLATSPTLVTPLLGTPTSGNLANCTGLPLTGLAAQAAWTFLVNNTSGSASPTAQDIHSLTVKATPASTDEVIIWDIAGAALKKATVSGIGTSSGVTSLNTSTGAISLSVVKQVFVANGTYTPTSGMVYCVVECVGGGGGGGGSAGATSATITGAGGGGGNYSRSVISAATIGASKAVAIGAAGSAGATGNNAGGNGGDTTLNTTTVVAKGGTGGSGSLGVPTVGGAGGVAGTGDITIPGERGGASQVTTVNAIYVSSGRGGNSLLGCGAGNVVTVNGVLSGNAGGNYGAGGSGGVAQNTASTTTGGAGSAGVMYITEYCIA